LIVRGRFEQKPLDTAATAGWYHIPEGKKTMLKRPCIAQIDWFGMSIASRKQCGMFTWDRGHLIEDDGSLFVTREEDSKTICTPKQVHRMMVVLAPGDTEGVALVNRAIVAGFAAQSREIGDEFGPELKELGTNVESYDWRFSSLVLGKSRLYMSGRAKTTYIGRDMQWYIREKDGFHHYVEAEVLQEIFEDKYCPILQPPPGR
jgi:hypothetical protein